jgi:hypothetical protein
MQTPENDGAVRFLYGTALGRGLLKIVQALHLDRLAVWYLRSRWSRPYIAKFARKNSIPLTKAELQSFPTYRDFFLRERAPRPVDLVPEHLVSPCDGWLSAFPVTDGCSFAIKGSRYRVADLLQDAALAERYHDAGVFGQTLTASILYMITSGCTASTQYAYARMLELSCDGVIDFVEDTREYERRAARMKDIFCRNGFHVVYDRDVTRPVGDGFFFTLGYEGLTGGELLRELLYYGVSCISLSTTGSLQNGVRGCTSRMRDELYPVLEERMKAFREDH